MTNFTLKRTKLFALLFAFIPSFLSAQIDLLQTTDNTIVDGLVYSCIQNPFTAENEFARLYNLPQLGYSSFEVTKVSFAIDELTLQAGSELTVEVKIYSSTGGTSAANLTYEGGQSVTFTNSTSLTIVEVVLDNPVTISSDEMFISVLVPDGIPTETNCSIGGNSNGETAPAYVRAPGCDTPDFVDYSVNVLPDAHVVLFPTGFPTLLPCPVGDVFLSSQAEVDQFGIDYPNCTHIEGHLFLQTTNGTTDITNLSGLSNIVSIGGHLGFNNNTVLNNLDGLSNLTSVGGGLTFFNNGITNLNALNSLESVSGFLYIANNPNLSNLAGLASLEQFSGNV